MSITLANTTLHSHLWLGSAGYPSLDILLHSLRSSGTDLVTVSLKRHRLNDTTQHYFYDSLRASTCTLLPNTAGCKNAHDAITMAHCARECFNTALIKLEVISDALTLAPHVTELIKAATVLVKDGFTVLPFCTDDLSVCQQLLEVGCTALMPWAAPIGSGQGITNGYALARLRARYPDALLIVDAGIGRPSDATQLMEMGFDAVLINTAIAHAVDPAHMARAFAGAVDAGRTAKQAGIMQPRTLAQASTPLTDTPFWAKDATL